MSYTHLQVRSGYSLMNSTITIDRLVSKAKELDFDALALTDENVLYGTIPFYKKCIQNGIKPIIGMTVAIDAGESGRDTCVLLAKNNQGYKNLIKISTGIQLSGDGMVKRTDVERYSSDLICILPTVGNTLESLLVTKTHDEVSAYLDEKWGMFQHGNLFLGVQDHGLQTEESVRTALRAFQEKYHVQVVAWNDVRYIDNKDDIAFDCLRAMKLDREWSLKKTSPAIRNRYLRPAAEMRELFADWPEVVANTQFIINNCDVSFDFEKRMIPAYPVPEGLDAHSYLEKLCWQNLEEKYQHITDEIKERLTYELGIIQSMQFSDYFLIVWDFIAYAKRNNIMVGPGRGSAAGSLVAYVLDITEVDPIEYDLLFERFLNPERITMPDIDIDFSDHRRDEVIDYVREKYGSDHVAQIITFGTFAARSLLRELIKTMGISQQDAYFILKEIPVQARKPIAEYVKESPDLEEYIKQSPQLKALFMVAAKLEGLPRHISTHAAGVVISDQPLIEDVPLTTGTSETRLTQYPMNDLEAVGLLKMDFLGLRNLTLIERIIQTIRYAMKQNVNLSELPGGDQKTYDLLQHGQTNGVFQLESQGMKQVLTRLHPTSFEDIVAVNALFRPGPMENIPIYINRKHGREKIVYPHPDLEPILKKTYGVLIYQEQIMQIAHKIAGFTLGQADILRRAVSKKQQQVMDEQKDAFIRGCLENGYSHKVAEEIFNWIVKFSNYGFNRSHAVAYSRISYQLAYLKAHYTKCFFAELLSSVGNQHDKVNSYMKEMRELGIELAPPSINKSFGKFSVEEDAIRMGFLTIKGIGSQAVKEIVRVRKDGPFTSLFDFCLRVSMKLVNRASLETMIMAGAFDSLYENRASLLASIDQAMEQGELFKEFNDQPSLFQDMIDLDAAYVEIEDFPLAKKLQDEKELLGIYVSSHPLKQHRTLLEANGYIDIVSAGKLAGKTIKSAAILQAMKTIRTKRGDPMAFVTVGDETGDMEAVIFPDLYREVHRWLKEGSIITFKGKMEMRNNRVQCLLSEIREFNEEEWGIDSRRRLFIKITEQNSENALSEIKRIVGNHPGNTAIVVHHADTKATYQLSHEYLTNAGPECLKLLQAQFGENNVVLRKENG